MPRRQRWNKAVHFSVKGHLLEDFAAVGLEGGSEVVNVDAAQLGHEPVGAAGRKAAQPEIVYAVLAPSADDVIPLGDFFQENRNVGGIVLQIAVHGDDVFAAGVIQSGGWTCRLAKGAAQPYNRDAAG